MNSNRIINITLISMLIFFVAGVGVFFYDANNNYVINTGFTSVPLEFDPDDSSSTYEMAGVTVTVHGGFVKGIQKDTGKDSLVIRALAPLPSIAVSGNGAISINLENVNPEFYAKCIESSGQVANRIAANTLNFQLTANAATPLAIVPVIPDGNSGSAAKIVILGDNRDGYDTFEKIINQVNGISPAVVIDNGDLVFGGKPNQYRLFDQLASNISTTLLTTLGNHDIRGSGKDTYTMLYGPAYYSFDYLDSHFIFLDSSPGWSQFQAISDQQYSWLENDLRKSQGRNIFVVSHIPPVDPRSGVTQNEIANYFDKVASGDNYAEQFLDNYNSSKNMEHGFQDPEEARKFENLMSEYHVNTVFLSHIHSYFDYTKEGVRYVISGGAGAELLTKNSYYHYMIGNLDNPDTLTMVELSSPANTYIARYLATVKLFGVAMYQENKVAVTLIITGAAALGAALLTRLYLWKKKTIQKSGRLLVDIFRYSINRFKELFPLKHKPGK